MKEFIDYLTHQIETGRENIARLEADDRRDDADFAKVRVNIYDVCRTVTIALIDRPVSGADAVKNRFERFREEWTAALDKAKAHDDTRNIVVGETKLEALADVITHFEEIGK